MKEKVEMLALLKHTIGYFEDATRDLETLLESLSEDDFEGLSADLDAVYNMLILKRAENALASGLRFYERFKKRGGANDG